MSDIAPVLKPSLPPLASTPEPVTMSRAVDTGHPVALPVEKAPRSPTELQDQLDRILESADTSLRFRVDEQSQRVVVAVIGADGEVLMQIPDRAALAVARQFARTGTLLDLKA